MVGKTVEISDYEIVNEDIDTDVKKDVEDETEEQEDI